MQLIDVPALFLRKFRKIISEKKSKVTYRRNLIAFVIAIIVFPMASSAQEQNSYSISNRLQTRITDQQLLKIWNDFFQTPRYYMANDGSEPLSQFCLSAAKVSATNSKSPLIILSLKRILRRPPNENPNLPNYEVSPDQPHYIFLFEANFPDKDSNPVYQMWLTDGDLKADYIGVGLSENLQNLAGKLTTKNISSVVSLFIYSSKTSGSLNEYDKAIRSPALSFSGDELPLKCK